MFLGYDRLATLVYPFQVSREELAKRLGELKGSDSKRVADYIRKTRTEETFIDDQTKGRLGWLGSLG